MNSLFSGRAVIAFATLLILGACSKNESTETTATSPTPTATISPSLTPTPAPSATVSPSITPLPTSSPLANLEGRMRDMEARMDSVFADAFRGVGNWFDQSKLASSVDLREQNDKYIARVYVPRADTSKVDAKIDNGALHITATVENNANGNITKENYEQVITLPKPVQAENMQIERKQNVVVISVPKTMASAPTVASAATPSPTTSSLTTTSTDWGDIMSNQFAEMQRRMDQAFRDVFGADTSAGASTAELGSAVNVDEQKDKYVVHFYLPDRDLSNVKVNFENGHLALTAAEEQKSTTNKSATGMTESTTAGHYEEMITLAGPVNDKEMKMEPRCNQQFLQAG